MQVHIKISPSKYPLAGLNQRGYGGLNRNDTGSRTVGPKTLGPKTLGTRRLVQRQKVQTDTWSKGHLVQRTEGTKTDGPIRHLVQ